MADSWEDNADAGSGSKLNVNASSFTFSPSAAAWSPGGFAPPPPAPMTMAPPAPPEPPTPPPGDEEEEEEMDENDPLWIAVLKIAKGDRAAGLKLLEDPDSLMQYPAVAAIMNGTAVADEKANAGVAAQAASEAESAAAEAAQAAAYAEAAARAATKPAPAPEPAEEEEEEEEPELEEEIGEEDQRDHLNLVFIGHVDAGKSTLCGQILYITENVDKRTIEKYEREAKERNRESWFLAFIMDTNEEERAKGKTVEVGRAHFNTDTNRYTILDAPGHKNYVPNMISGASQADVGVLVISARRGEFEAGFDRGGQTREHALLAKTLGVRHLVVVINKMDDPTVLWDKERYEECIAQLKPFLRECGYRPKIDVKFLPISALTGDNILHKVDTAKVPAAKWWDEYTAKGEHNTSTPSLVSTLDSLDTGRDTAKGPLRMPVLDRYHERGTNVLGKVESGTLSRGMKICVQPMGTVCKVESILIDEKLVRTAKPGENVCVKLSTVGVEDVIKGFVLCDAPRPCHKTKKFVATFALVEMLEHRPLFTSGYSCMLHVHTCETEVICVKLVSKMESKKKGEEMRPRFAKQGAQVTAVLEVPQSICVENFEVFQQLGRFTLRDEGRTIAIGKIGELIESSS